VVKKAAQTAYLKLYSSIKTGGKKKKIVSLECFNRHVFSY